MTKTEMVKQLAAQSSASGAVMSPSIIFVERSEEVEKQLIERISSVLTPAMTSVKTVCDEVTRSTREFSNKTQELFTYTEGSLSRMKEAGERMESSMKGITVKTWIVMVLTSTVSSVVAMKLLLGWLLR